MARPRKQPQQPSGINRTINDLVVRLGQLRQAQQAVNALYLPVTDETRVLASLREEIDEIQAAIITELCKEERVPA